MRDYYSLGPTPSDEDCCQVGAENYSVESRKECIRYRDQIVKQFGGIEKLDEVGVRIGIKSFLHEYGTYREVCVFFDDEDEEQCRLAIEIEDGVPEKWDS